MKKEKINKTLKKLQIKNKYVKYLTLGLFLTGLIIITIGMSHSMYYNNNVFSCTETHLTITTPEEFEVFGNKIEIDSVLWEPKNDFDIYEKRPAIVYLHGFSGNKMAYKGLAHELGRRGIVGLSISARGHGGSSGPFGFTSSNETLSAVKWLRENAEEYRIDINRIGVAGSSQGAFSVTLAAIIDFELGYNWINATIVMDGPSYRGGEGRSDFSELALQASQWIYPTLNYDLQEDLDLLRLENSQPINHTIVPRNYLYLLGGDDFIYTPDAAKELLWHYGQNETYGTTNYKDLALDTQYGSFSNGTARKISYMPGVGHGGAGGSAKGRTDMIEWVENAFSINGGDVVFDNDYLKNSGQGANLVQYGILVIILPFTIYFGNYARSRRNISEVAKEIEGKKLVKLFSLYGAIFIGTTALVIPVIKTFNLMNVIIIDFLAFNIVVLGFFVQAILLLPFLILLMYFEKKKFNEKLKDFGLDTDYQSNLKNILFGVSIFLIIFIPFSIVGGPLISWYIPPVKFLGFLEAFAYLLFACIINGLFLNGLIQTKLSRYEKDKLILIPSLREIIYTAGITAIFLGPAFYICFYFFGLENPEALSNIASMLPSPLLIFFISIAVFFVLGCISGWLYRKTRNIFGPAVLSALFISLIVASFLPAI